MSDTLTITPSVIIRRSRSGKAGFQVIDVSHEENGERALLAFASPEIAETFRSDTGTYPEEDGFIVMPSDVEQLRVVLWGGDFKRAALRGLGAQRSSRSSTLPTSCGCSWRASTIPRSLSASEAGHRPGRGPTGPRSLSCP